MGTPDDESVVVNMADLGTRMVPLNWHRAVAAERDTLKVALREIVEDEWAATHDEIEYGDLQRMVSSHVSVARTALEATEEMNQSDVCSQSEPC